MITATARKHVVRALREALRIREGQAGALVDSWDNSFAIGLVDADLRGVKAMVLEGCDGIVEYGAEQIGFRCGRQQVWVRGKNLRLVRVEEDSAVLSGKIEEVAYR